MAFVTLKSGVEPSEILQVTLKQFVVDKIGPIARPKQIVFTPDLPKTRSGKIIRRILKQIVAGESIGDTTSLANHDIVDLLQKQYAQQFEISK